MTIPGERSFEAKLSNTSGDLRCDLPTQTVGKTPSPTKPKATRQPSLWIPSPGILRSLNRRGRSPIDPWTGNGNPVSVHRTQGGLSH